VRGAPQQGRPHHPGSQPGVVSVWSPLAEHVGNINFLCVSFGRGLVNCWLPVYVCYSGVWNSNFSHVLQQGDSGFVIVRNGLITFRSPVLQHFFDCPLQFGAVPEHTNASDYAEDADLFELAVQVRPCNQHNGSSLQTWQTTYVHQLFPARPVRRRLADHTV
jgi:hypothetical protein